MSRACETILLAGHSPAVQSVGVWLLRRKFPIAGWNGRWLCQFVAAVHSVRIGRRDTVVGDVWNDERLIV